MPLSVRWPDFKRCISLDRMCGILLVWIFACLGIEGVAQADIGGSDVFYEGTAGSYHLYFTATMPRVVPGIALVQIRCETDGVKKVEVLTSKLTGEASQFRPVADLAARSTKDPRLFTDSLWIMRAGALRIRVTISGSHGKGEMSVPVPAAPQMTMPMQRWLLGAITLMMAILASGLVSIVSSAVREAHLTPGTRPDPRAIRNSRVAGLTTGAFALTAIGLGYIWWSTDAKNYAEEVKTFKSPFLSAKVQNGVLRLRPLYPAKSKLNLNDLLPDHGHLVHMFLVEQPEMKRIWHLHPKLTANSGVMERMPSVPAGNYRIFADIVDKFGFPWTLAGQTKLPRIAGIDLTGDDSSAIVSPLGTATSSSALLPGGGWIFFDRNSAPKFAGRPGHLLFRVEDRDGTPARDLDAYMGMAAHAVIVRSDFRVFAHIHPTGSIPMASLSLMAGDEPGTMLRGMVMPGDKIDPHITFPYGFPRPGLYRIFVQIKRAGRVETVAFDMDVSSSSARTVPWD
jgi:hypothetical protein